jgi:hypothetical protein
MSDVSWAPHRANNEPPQNVHVQGYVHTTANFNDYVQTALLTANLVSTQETNNLLRQEATRQKLAWWKSVVLNRFPGISDPMDIEDSAMALMAWDAREVKAAHSRRAGRHLPSRLTWGECLWSILAYVVCGVIAVAVVFMPTLFISAIIDKPWNTVDNYANLIIAIIVGWLSLNTLYGTIVWSPPQYDPTRHSEICRRFPLGSTIRDTKGEAYIVTGWPVYYAERLRFWYPVDHASSMTTVNTDDGSPWLQSDVILWNDGTNGPIPGSVQQ